MKNPSNVYLILFTIGLIISFIFAAISISRNAVRDCAIAVMVLLADLFLFFVLVGKVL